MGKRRRNYQQDDDDVFPPVSLQVKTLVVRTPKQKEYLEAVTRSDLTIALGPAGTGKTYLAVSCAVTALRNKQVNRIVITRPIVEAGERLGFLPGDLQEKVNPYLRPIFDAFIALIGPEKFTQLWDQNVIEVAPLAFMRGRTLESSFIILDEAQNTTQEQMKMFLTRFGANSKAIVTGDVTQIDLPQKAQSGLIQAVKILKNVAGVSIVSFADADVVRHELVKRIVKAYTDADQAPF